MTANLNPRQFNELERACAELHATRNAIIKLAICEFIGKYTGLGDDHPSLAVVQPKLRPTVNNERFNQLDARVCAIENWMIGDKRPADPEVLRSLKSDLIDQLDKTEAAFQSRTPSAAFLQARDKVDAQRHGNTFVETAAGSGRGRRARFAPGSLATQSEGNGDWRKPQDVDATEPKSSTTARVGKKDE